MPNDGSGPSERDGPPRLSVVVVGRDGMQSLVPILHCLSGQTLAREMEVIAVLPGRACPPDAMEPWAGRFRAARAVPVPRIGNRGRAAAAGVRVATAPVLAFTENHCFPDPDWAEALCAAQDGAYAGIAPVVLNANPESALSWAIHGSGYARFSDRAGAEDVEEMPLHNTSYRRERLMAYDNGLEELLSHESRIQARLRADGHRFRLVPSARTRHVNEATWTLVLGLNFCNGWRYGGRRGEDWPVLRRAAYAALFPLLSVNVMRETLRRYRSCAERPRLSVPILWAMALQSLAHTAGEAMGYVAGPRFDFAFADDEEFMILERLGGHPLADPRLAGFVAHAVPLEHGA